MGYSYSEISKAGVKLFSSFMEEHEFNESSNLEFRKIILENSFDYLILSRVAKMQNNKEIIDNESEIVKINEIVKYTWINEFFNFIDSIYPKVYLETNIDSKKYNYLCDFVFGIMMNCNKLAVNTSWIRLSAMPVWSYAFIEHENKYKKYFNPIYLASYSLDVANRKKIIMNGISLSSSLRIDCDQKYGSISNTKYYRLLNNKLNAILIILILLISLIILIYFKL